VFASSISSSVSSGVDRSRVSNFWSSSQLCGLGLGLTVGKSASSTFFKLRLSLNLFGSALAVRAPLGALLRTGDVEDSLIVGRGVGIVDAICDGGLGGISSSDGSTEATGISGARSSQASIWRRLGKGGSPKSADLRFPSILELSEAVDHFKYRGMRWEVRRLAGHAA